MQNNPQYYAPPQPPRPTRYRKVGATMMVRGVLMAVAGVVLTIVAQVIASSVGSTFSIVFSGLIIVGIIYTIIGFFRWIAAR